MKSKCVIQIPSNLDKKIQSICIAVPAMKSVVWMASFVAQKGTHF